MRWTQPAKVALEMATSLVRFAVLEISCLARRSGRARSHIKAEQSRPHPRHDSPDGAK